MLCMANTFQLRVMLIFPLLPFLPPEYLMEQILHRIPAMEHAEIRQMINGPEGFTPDLHAIIGEAPQVCLIILPYTHTLSLFVSQHKLYKHA